MKINWTESSTEDSRISINDDVITCYAEVSIHAPAWGATPKSRKAETRINE